MNMAEFSDRGADLVIAAGDGLFVFRARRGVSWWIGRLGVRTGVFCKKSAR
jgi:hypothetical protein